MPLLLEIANLYKSQTLKDRTLGAVVKKIPYVRAETKDSYFGHGAPFSQAEDDEFAKRQTLASAAASTPEMIRDRFFSYILANGDIQANGEASTDAQIEYVVGFHWSDVAKTVG